MTITTKNFGTTAGGHPVTLYRLTNRTGAYVEFLDYGAAIRSIVIPDRHGALTDVCLGYDTIGEYESNDGCLGAVIGRHANRIAGGQLTIGGTTYPLACNNGPNHLHGGVHGFHTFVWKTELLEDGLCFSRRSPDGEEGYPGNLDVQVTCRWDDLCRLCVQYDAVCDADTAVNLTNHTYFNLAGGGSVLRHVLQLEADRFLPVDADGLAFGPIETVSPAMDFRTPKPVGRDIACDDPNLTAGKGYDHHYVLRHPTGDSCSAVLSCPDTGIVLRLYTDQPGVQLYTANFLTRRRGKGGVPMQERSALCLETQHCPNSLACGFQPSALLPAHTAFRSQTAFCFGRMPGEDR